MENSDLNKILNEALKMFDDGRDYSQIRSSLEGQGVEKEEVSYIIRLVDEFAIEARKAKEKKIWSRKKMIYGVLFIIIAVIKALMFQNLGYLYTAYGLLVAIPFAIGLFLIWNGYSNLKKWNRHEPEIDDSKLKLIRRL